MGGRGWDEDGSQRNFFQFLQRFSFVWDTSILLSMKKFGLKALPGRRGKEGGVRK